MWISPAWIYSILLKYNLYFPDYNIVIVMNIIANFEERGGHMSKSRWGYLKLISFWMLNKKVFAQESEIYTQWLKN